MKKNLLLPILLVCLIQLCSCTRFVTPVGSKITVSREATGSTYSNGHSTTTYTQYIEKAGENRVRFNGKNLVNAVSDNPDALKHAKIYKAARPVVYGGFLVMFAGIIYGIAGQDSNPKLASTSGAIGLIAIPVMITGAIFGSHHAKKAIKIYNSY